MNVANGIKSIIKRFSGLSKINVSSGETFEAL